MSTDSKRVLTRGVLNAPASNTAANAHSRTLIFYANNLGQDTNLMLTFDLPKSNGPGQEAAALCWKVVRFAASGTQQARVEYTADTAFFVPEIESGNLVHSTNAQLCSTGEKCSVITKDGTNFITPPEKGTPGKIECYNKTRNKTSIGFGFYSQKTEQVEPAFLWQNVPVDYKAQIELTPILSIYATYDYQETEIIRGHIVSDVLWRYNLINLDKVTHWDVAIDMGTGILSITQRD